MKKVSFTPALVLAMFLTGAEGQAAVAEDFYQMPDPGVITHPEQTVQTDIAEKITGTASWKK